CIPYSPDNLQVPERDCIQQANLLRMVNRHHGDLGEIRSLGLLCIQKRSPRGLHCSRELLEAVSLKACHMEMAAECITGSVRGEQCPIDPGQNKGMCGEELDE